MENWQREYRFGVILIFPPEPVLSEINRLRAKYDPRSQASCDAHISLTVPAPEPILDQEWEKLAQAAAACEPFPIQYGPPKSFPPHPGVTLGIEPHGRLDELRKLLEALAPFDAAPARRWPFRAHMTIAEFITADRTYPLLHELSSLSLEGEFQCTHLSYAVPDRTFHFSEHRRLTLGHRSTDP